MRVVGGGRIWLLASAFALALPAVIASAPANATESDKAAHAPAHPVVRHAAVTHQAPRRVTHPTTTAANTHTVVRKPVTRVAYHSGWMSCVPFARSATGIAVAGNAWQWWDHASGVYQRGNVPEPGGVLAFRANGHMRLGHVAVVSRVVNDREILIDHANWGGGGIMRGVPVVDVSENNDWTAVRVGLSRDGAFGSVYPTYGFIYDRPDNGRMLVAITAPAPTPSLNPAPRDLRTPAQRAATTQMAAARHYDEVAEAPETPRRSSLLSGPADRH
jgi:surface antigen